MKRGAQLVFEGGTLTLNLEGYVDVGSGHFAFTEDDLEPFAEWDDEDGTRWDGWLAKLPSSELAAIRDFLNQYLPAESGAKGSERSDEGNPAPDDQQSQATERLREAMREACDLLAERAYGSQARSPGHNARLVLEAALSVTEPSAEQRPSPNPSEPRT